MRKIFFPALIFFLPAFLFSQGTTPAQQAKIDSLMMYINLQMKGGKTPDPKYIDSMNAVIRTMNPKQVKPDSSSKVSDADSLKEITKQSIAGSSFTVPPRKIWKVKRVYVNDGGSYNILVTSVKFDKPFVEGDKIFAPTWCAEAELLNGDKSGLTYILKIEEANAKK